MRSHDLGHGAASYRRGATHLFGVGRSRVILRGPQRAADGPAGSLDVKRRRGGRFAPARDRANLAEIYAEIGTLERTERREQRYEETFDVYIWSLLPAIILYGLSWLSSATWARRLA